MVQSCTQQHLRHGVKETLMLGYDQKNYGTNEEKLSKKRSGLSLVHFVCPNAPILQEQKRSSNVQCEKPDIINSNIHAIGRCPK